MNSKPAELYLYNETGLDFSSLGDLKDAPFFYNEPLSGFLPNLTTQPSLVLPQKTLLHETLMELEEEAADTTFTKYHTKDCLKVGRRLIKLLEKHLKTRSKLIETFLGAAGKIINSIFPFFDIQEPEMEEVLRAATQILQKMWEEFKNCLSYNKNKKICVVKAEYWNVIFSNKTFVSYALKECNNLEKSRLKDALFNVEGVVACFCQILFFTNQLLLLILIFKDQTAKGGKFLRTVETISNLVVLMIEPSLFEFYNHRSGKFPNECCRRCKICCSKSIPIDFEITLQRARDKANVLAKAIFEICPESLDDIKHEELLSILVLLAKQ